MSVTKFLKDSRKSAILFAVITAVLIIPAAVFAVPGSGDFVSLESTSGRDITDLYNFIAKACLVILIIVEGVLITAILKFRRKSDDERPEQVHGNLKLEFGWTMAALLLQVYIGWITVDTMFEVETIPETEMTVEAIGYQWDWEFRYPDHGGFVHEDLIIPANTNVKLEVTSRDVIHSLFIPELGTKIDAVPGRFNYWWVNADGPLNRNDLTEVSRQRTDGDARQYTTRPDWWKYATGDFFPTTDRFYDARKPSEGGQLEREVGYLGKSRIGSSTTQYSEGEPSPYAKYDAIEYRGMCTELCGKDHWDMYFRTVSMTPSSFEQWVEDKKTGGTGEVDGEKLYTKNCASCHQSDGTGLGDQYPPLVGTKWVTQEDMKSQHIHVVLVGSNASSLKGDTTVLGKTYTGIMQPWSQKFNDAEVAAIVNHERLSWGNDGGEVTEEDVAAAREELGLPAFPAGGAEPIPDKDLRAIGQRVYKSCVSCHGAEGKGPSTVPNLAQSPLVLSDVAGTVELLVNGRDLEKWPGAQPPMGKSMTDKQIAGVLTYMRQSFGNEASAVQPEEVQRIRKEIANN
jgi:cytochrome c oxidase subunit II